MPSFAESLRKIEVHDDEPLYRQLEKRIREAINRSRLRADEALPPERELATALNVSRITVRKAIEGLVKEGLLKRRQGAGTFVASRVEKNFAQLSSFSEEMRSRGLEPESRWLERIVGVVTPDEVMSYGLSPGDRIYRLRRLRFANGAPMALENSIVPERRLPSIDAIGASLYRALEDAGNRPVRAVQRLRAVALSAEHADLLERPEGAPALLVERRGFLDDGQIVEICRTLYCGDAYEMFTELSA